ncbi:MAG: carbamoyltransferase HypF, partial [Bacillota bacterium]
MMVLTNEKTKRFIIDVKGIVQGVGFRPFIYNLARTHIIKGSVSNYPGGVRIEAEGIEDMLFSFIQKIKLEAPPLSYIEHLNYEEADLAGYKDFKIRESSHDSPHETLISPDIAVCEDCLGEMNNPDDRRYLYPFINCTNCGPRFTITTNIPYDRVNTTMQGFKMCRECEDEYSDPFNRRYHAQPTACSKCGPKIVLLDGEGNMVAKGQEFKKAHELFAAGKIIAVKGLGGYHLACDAKNSAAVMELRRRKIRDGKPFALMAKDMDTVYKYCYVNKKEQELLLSIKKPIVLLERKLECDLDVRSIASDSNRLGVMLPYTPLQYLLFDENIDLLIMTSGNKTGEPIFYKDDEALKGLRNIADYFLIGNRDIYLRTDDSVTSVLGDKEYIIRRSRGYVPFPVDISISLGMKDEAWVHTKLPFVLGCGGELKNTFCITKDKRAFLSHHIGDLENIETLRSFDEGIEHFKRIFNVNPDIIAFDKHPEYLSSKYAREAGGLIKVPVQHHHAHIASCMVENRVSSKVIGIAFDGTGYGEDGHIWGGEFFVGDYSHFERAAHLEYVPLPGGEISIREPWRMALSFILKYLSEDMINNIDHFFSSIEPYKVEMVKHQIIKKINTPLTSSMGRLFDGVSSLLGLCNAIEYEGQAAIRLQQIADISTNHVYS